MDELVNKRINEVLKGDQDAFEEIVTLFQHRFTMFVIECLATHKRQKILRRKLCPCIYQHSYIRSKTEVFNMVVSNCDEFMHRSNPKEETGLLSRCECAGNRRTNMYSQIAASGELPEEEVERMETQERIQYEIGRLPDKYRSVIILRYIEELPLQEIGDILELPLGTVKTRVHRGREALRKQMGNM